MQNSEQRLYSISNSSPLGRSTVFRRRLYVCWARRVRALLPLFVGWRQAQCTLYKLLVPFLSLSASVRLSPKPAWWLGLKQNEPHWAILTLDMQSMSGKMSAAAAPAVLAPAAAVLAPPGSSSSCQRQGGCREAHGCDAPLPAALLVGTPTASAAPTPAAAPGAEASDKRARAAAPNPASARTTLSASIDRVDSSCRTSKTMCSPLKIPAHLMSDRSQFFVHDEPFR